MCAECRNRGPGREAMTFLLPPGQPRGPPGTPGDRRAPLRSLPKLSPAVLPAGGPALAGGKGGKYPLVSFLPPKGRQVFVPETHG